MDILKYNKNNKGLGCATPYYFEPTFTFMGFLHEQSDVRPKKFRILRALEDRQLSAVTHLALARRQNRRKRHFGYLQKIVCYKRRNLKSKRSWYLGYFLSSQKIRMNTKDYQATEEEQIIYKREKRGCQKAASFC